MDNGVVGKREAVIVADGSNIVYCTVKFRWLALCKVAGRRGNLSVVRGYAERAHSIALRFSKVGATQNGGDKVMIAYSIPFQLHFFKCTFEDQMDMIKGMRILGYKQC